MVVVFDFFKLRDIIPPNRFGFLVNDIVYLIGESVLSLRNWLLFSSCMGVDMKNSHQGQQNLTETSLGSESFSLLELLAQASTDIQASSTVEDACKVVSDAVFKLGYYGIQVSEINWAARTVEASYTSGPRWPKIQAETRRALSGNDILAICLRDLSPVFIPDSRQNPYCEQGAIERSGIVSQYIIPLTTRTSKIGTLQVDCGEINELPRQHKVLIDALAANLALVMERAILSSEIEETFDMAMLLEKQALAGFASAGITHQLSHDFEPVRKQVRQFLKDPYVRERRPLLDFLRKLDNSFDAWLDRAREPLVFARAEKKEASCNVHDVIESVQRLWYHRARMAKCRIHRDLAEEESRVLLGEADLSEILGCLIVNSIQAHARNIWLRTRTRDERIQEVTQSCVRIEVIDDGQGITADIRSRIFDPSFTTKPEREGTGLGLPIAQAIAKTAGGDVFLVESTRYKQTVFAAVLPRLESEG